MQPPMWQFKKWHTVGWFHVCMYYNKYISKRGGMYHWKRKRSTLPLPSFFFIKSIKNKGTITFKTFFKGVTGDPGGSSLVSFDTDRCYMHLSSNSFCACFSIASLTPSDLTINSSNCFWVSLLCTLKFSSASIKQSSSISSWCNVDIIKKGN